MWCKVGSRFRLIELPAGRARFVFDIVHIVEQSLGAPTHWGKVGVSYDGNIVPNYQPLNNLGDKGTVEMPLELSLACPCHSDNSTPTSAMSYGKPSRPAFGSTRGDNGKYNDIPSTGDNDDTLSTTQATGSKCATHYTWGLCLDVHRANTDGRKCTLPMYNDFYRHPHGQPALKSGSYNNA